MPTVADYQDFFNGKLSLEELRRIADSEARRTIPQPASTPAPVRAAPVAPAPTRVVSPTTGRQCGACSGSGRVLCSSCNGMGSHTTSGTRTGYDGELEFYTDHVPCGCGGGYSTCGACGGAGRL